MTKKDLKFQNKTPCTSKLQSSRMPKPYTTQVLFANRLRPTRAPEHETTRAPTPIPQPSPHPIVRSPQRPRPIRHISTMVRNCRFHPLFGMVRNTGERCSPAPHCVSGFWSRHNAHEPSRPPPPPTCRHRELSRTAPPFAARNA